MFSFIVNERAGGGRCKNKWNKLKAFLDKNGVKYAYRLTEYKGHAEEIAKEFLANGTTAIIAVGGDGTVHEIVNGFKENISALNLGVIPAGTGNDYVLPLGVPKCPIKAFKLILNCEPKAVDIMNVSGRLAVCFATSGLDIALVESVNNLGKKRASSYFKMLLKEIRKNETYSFKITADEKIQTVNTFFVGISTNGFVGAGMKICPVAKVADGILDFVIVKKRSILSFFKIIFALYFGNILRQKGVKLIRAEQFEIVPLTLNAVDLDGEIYYNHPFNVGIVKEAYKLYY
ncbi:MAG: diacylglycerol kinase family lipid kinase [Firmicutes bacterium]|nr:diacylglycerol kinase family lipid kinase [Bacillota bacterium]